MLEITRCHAINKGAVVANVEVEILKWGFLISDITIFSSNGRRWIQFPAKVTEKDGQKKYWQYCRFKEKDVTERFTKALLTAYDQYATQHPEEASHKVAPFPKQEIGEVPF